MVVSSREIKAVGMSRLDEVLDEGVDKVGDKSEKGLYIGHSTRQQTSPTGIQITRSLHRTQSLGCFVHPTNPFCLLLFDACHVQHSKAS